MQKSIILFAYGASKAKSDCRNSRRTDYRRIAWEVLFKNMKIVVVIADKRSLKHLKNKSLSYLIFLGGFIL